MITRETDQGQWISGITTEDPLESYTLIHETGAPVAHVQYVNGAWAGFWFDGTPAGIFATLGEAMDVLEQPAPECAVEDCENVPALGLGFCYSCMYESGPVTVTFDKDWS